MKKFAYLVNKFSVHVPSNKSITMLGKNGSKKIVQEK